MSLWWCDTCKDLYGPVSPPICPKCATGLASAKIEPSSQGYQQFFINTTKYV